MQVSQQSKEEIYDELKERILTLQALPHEKLSENAVARQMHVSRTIVRGALSRLTDEGLITVLPQSGTFVNCISMKKGAADDLRVQHDSCQASGRALFSQAFERRECTDPGNGDEDAEPVWQHRRENAA
jgi:DNA-binding FadR family transcriptional regulator